MTLRRVSVPAALCASLVAVTVMPWRTPTASGAPGAGRVALGVLGDATRFRAQTGQRSALRHVIISWNQGAEWGTRLPALLQQMRPTPFLGIGTSDWRTKSEVVSPRRSPRAGPPTGR